MQCAQTVMNEAFMMHVAAMSNAAHRSNRRSIERGRPEQREQCAERRPLLSVFVW
jgi:hypothetical protein